MNAPNLYDFATSELSQDATLAYILSWARPQHRDQNPVLNRLGEHLLRALVAASAEALGRSNPLADSSIKKLEVGRQRDGIDVWAEVNDAVFLLIEDKTETCEHSEQIARYIQKLKEKHRDSTSDLIVMPVYVKTGNESRYHRPASASCGLFLRGDLLAALSGFPDTGNTIIEEFRQHLQRWQDDTEIFRHVPSGQWSRRARQGYYMTLEEWLLERCQSDNPGRKRDVGWGYVSNAAGGFWAFWWHGRPYGPRRCRLYLQIENGSRLQIRASGAEDETGATVGVNKDLLWDVFHAVEATARQDRFQQVRIRKAGRYRGGASAAVTNVLFDDGAKTYMVADAQGVLDLPATKNRLEQAMDLLDAVCSAGEEARA